MYTNTSSTSSPFNPKFWSTYTVLSTSSEAWSRWNGIGPIYSNRPFLQRGHGIGIIVGGLWRSFVRPLLWLCAKAVGSAALATGRNIITDMADLKPQISDIVRRNVSESTNTVINRLSGQGRKRKRTTSAKRGGKKYLSRGNNKKRRKINIKKTSFSKWLHSTRRHGSGSIVG